MSKCTDPLRITLTVTVAAKDYSFDTELTSSETVVEDGATSVLTTSRNGSYVDLQVSLHTLSERFGYSADRMSLIKYA